jgi:hypothetical protein
VNDVLSEVVLAIGDEYFLASEAVGAVARGDRLGAQRADIRTRLRRIPLLRYASSWTVRSPDRASRKF